MNVKNIRTIDSWPSIENLGLDQNPHRTNQGLQVRELEALHRIDLELSTARPERLLDGARLLLRPPATSDDLRLPPPELGPEGSLLDAIETYRKSAHKPVPVDPVDLRREARAMAIASAVHKFTTDIYARRLRREIV